MADLIERTRPTDAGLAVAWPDEQRHQVLDAVLADASHSTDGPRRRGGRSRRWVLAAAAASVAAVTVAAPSALPGWFTRTAAADELNRVAASAKEQPAWEWADGQFLRVRSVETQENREEGWSQRVTYDDFHTTDGWTWSDRLVNGAVERYIFPPGWGWHRPDYATGMPTEPHLLDAFLRLRVQGSASQNEAVFVAIGDMLRAEAAPPAVRAAAIGVLGLNPGVNVDRTTDAQGRDAVRATLVEPARPGETQTLMLDSRTGVLLGYGATWSDGWYESRIVDRGIVDALPTDVAAALGTDKIGKAIENGQTTLIDDERGPDPVAGAEQTWTPAPEPSR